MEKKKCPQCKNLILKTSPTCLYCGRPNKFITKEYVNKKWNKDNNKNYLERDTTKSNFFNQKEKWIGIHLNGEKIYGSSLKEIRHIIDYPSLHAK